MPILSLHPKYLPDALIAQEHDRLHAIWDALAGDRALPDGEADLFRFRGRRGRLYVRHRALVEEMVLRGIPHATLLDRRPLDSGEWDRVETPDAQVAAEAAAVAGGPAGRIPVPMGADAATLTGADEVCSAIDVIVDQEILLGLWLRYRHLVMERSYALYRQLADPLRGRGRGAVYMLFDILIEEAFARDPEDASPRIAYETVWESLEGEATPDERVGYARLTAALEPGKVSLPMRRFLATAASRQGDAELLKSRMLNAYLAGC